MGLFLRQDENRSELQSKVIAELQRKTRENTLNGDATQPEPKFLENQHETRPAGMIIGLLIVVLVTILVVYLVNSQP